MCDRRGMTYDWGLTKNVVEGADGVVGGLVGLRPVAGEQPEGMGLGRPSAPLGASNFMK
jgi:hypothetical protein